LAGGEAAVEFRVLGPFEASDNGRPLDVGVGKQRALLAMLLLRANEIVSTDRLVDALWDDDPPASAINSIHVYVSQLRKVLPDGQLRTRGRGYALELDPEHLDLARFERLLDEGRTHLSAGEAEHAAEALRGGLGLWRGPPLSDFASEPFAQIEIARLEELHLAALEDRIEADLALGRHADLVPELEALVRAHPLREGLRAQLMLALYRSGRQADALAAYQQARRMLADELGLEPGRRLQELERAILSQDERLDPPRKDAIALRRNRRRSGVLIGVGAALLLAAATAVAVIELSGTDGPELTAVAANSVAAIDAKTHRLVAEMPVGNGPTSVATGEGSVWAASADAGTVSQINPEKKLVVDTIPVGAGPRAITTGKGHVWVTNSLDGSVSRIDPNIKAEVQRIPVGNGPDGIVYAAGSIWVANTGDNTIARIDADSGKRIKTLRIGATELAFGAGTLWASQRTANRVVRIDPSTGLIVHAIQTGNGPEGLAFGSDAAWVTNSLDGTVSRIDPETNTVQATIPTGNGTRAVAVDADGVWVSNELEGTVARIDPDANQVVRRIVVGHRPQGIAIVGGTVLVSLRESGGAHRGGTLRIRMSRRIDSIDTALAYDTASWPILRMTSDGLVAFNQASGLQGAQPVPNLAASLPTPTDGGKTYRFQLRPEIRYSDGTTVKPADFVRTIERVFRLRSGGSGYYAGIVGGASCMSKPKSCDLTRGIVADEDSRTVTFRLVAPDPEFLHKLALPFAYVVPDGTPLREARRPLPATGPYVIRSYRPEREIRLVRNDHFDERSRAAQPDGYPDKIVLKIGGTPRQAIDDVIAGRADLFSSAYEQTAPPADQMRAIRTRYAGQVHSNPQPTVVGLFLNTRAPPFDRLGVRRALNYAADRASAVEIAGGQSAAQPTCQILPANFPGYRPYCPYTAGSKGGWTGPDLAKARALVAASGTRGMNVTVWSRAKYPGVGRFAAKLLRSLGYRVSIEVRDERPYWPTIFDPRTKAQIGAVDWYTDYPTPAGFYNPVLSCPSFLGNANPAQFCDPKIDRQIAAAATEEANPDAVRGLWERIDRQTVDQAPWVPLVNPKAVDVLSRRVGNYQYSVHLGMLLDQLWVQ